MSELMNNILIHSISTAPIMDPNPTHLPALINLNDITHQLDVLKELSSNRINTILSTLHQTTSSIASKSLPLTSIEVPKAIQVNIQNFDLDQFISNINTQLSSTLLSTQSQTLDKLNTLTSIISESGQKATDIFTNILQTRIDDLTVLSNDISTNIIAPIKQTKYDGILSNQLTSLSQATNTQFTKLIQATDERLLQLTTNQYISTVIENDVNPAVSSILQQLSKGPLVTNLRSFLTSIQDSVSTASLPLPQGDGVSSSLTDASGDSGSLFGPYTLSLPRLPPASEINNYISTQFHTIVNAIPSSLSLAGNNFASGLQASSDKLTSNLQGWNDAFSSSLQRLPALRLPTDTELSVTSSAAIPTIDTEQLTTALTSVLDRSVNKATLERLEGVGQRFTQLTQTLEGIQASIKSGQYTYNNLLDDVSNSLSTTFNVDKVKLQVVKDTIVDQYTLVRDFLVSDPIHTYEPLVTAQTQVNTVVDLGKQLLSTLKNNELSIDDMLAYDSIKLPLEMTPSDVLKQLNEAKVQYQTFATDFDTAVHSKYDGLQAIIEGSKALLQTCTEALQETNEYQRFASSMDTYQQRAITGLSQLPPIPNTAEVKSQLAAWSASINQAIQTSLATSVLSRPTTPIDPSSYTSTTEALRPWYDTASQAAHTLTGTLTQQGKQLWTDLSQYSSTLLKDGDL